MISLVGRVGPECAEAGRRAGLLRAFEAARSRGAGSIVGRAGPEWVIGTPAQPAPTQIWLHEGDFAVLTGVPSVATGTDLARAAQERGIAAACAAEYARRGPVVLSDLRGSFALAIRLQQPDKTLLAVDRLGVASLYYSIRDEALTFASELAVLLGVPGVAGEIDPQAIYDYLYFHVVPGPRTAFKGLHRLPPAGFVERVRKAESHGRYWRARFERETERIAFEPEKKAFLELLEDAVRAGLATGKSVGCFLSGGTDSSTLAGMVSKVGGQPARTYSIGFNQKGFDEIEYARIAVRHFGTKHREYYVEPADIVRIAPTLPEIYGQPFGNSSVIPTYCCAEMARADGIDTMVAGDGGDELFGGNERYATQILFAYYLAVPRWLRRYGLEPFVALPGIERLTPTRKLKRYIEQARVPMPDRLQTYNHLKLLDRHAMLEDDFCATVGFAEPERSVAEEYGRASAQTIINKMLALDWKYTLADNDLPKVIGMCSAAGVGVVFPFLHPELVDFSSRLPAREKVSRLRLRYFFKRALADFLPPEIIRKKKHGFGMPFGDWLIAPGPLRELVFDNLRDFRGRGIVRAAFVDELCGPLLLRHPNYYGGLMWLFFVLEQWLRWLGTVQQKDA